jgi:FkbM family methyltransferase
MSLKKHIKRWLYGSCPGIAGAFPYFGTKVYFPNGSWSFLAACDQGIFESDNVRLLQGLVRPGTWLFDVGTNIGLMSLPVLKAISDARVLSFEPSPNVLEYLKRTIAESSHADRWTLVPKAVGEHEGKVSFNLASPEQSLFDGMKSAQRVAVCREVEVELTTIDSEWKSRGKPEVSMIKIDVEGAELAVLKGARECITFCNPHVLLEWNLQNLKAYDCPARAILEFANELNLRIFSLPWCVWITNEHDLTLHLISTESFLLSQ